MDTLPQLFYGYALRPYFILELTQLRQQLNSLTKQLSTGNQCNCKCMSVNTNASDHTASTLTCRVAVNNTYTEMMVCSDNATSLVSSDSVSDSSSRADNCVTDEANATSNENKHTFANILKQDVEKFQHVNYRKKRKSPVIGHFAAESQPFRGVYKKSVECIH